MSTIDKNFKGFAFTRNQLNLLGEDKHLMGLKILSDAKLLLIADATIESKEAKIARFFHTVMIKHSSGIENFTRGDDYWHLYFLYI